MEPLTCSGHFYLNRPVDLQEERQTPPSSKSVCRIVSAVFCGQSTADVLFSEKVVKTDQYTIETGCISCADEKRCGKVYGEKQRGISVCVK